MKRWYIAGALLIVIAGLLVYYFRPTPSPSYITNYPSSGTDIIAFGDSLVVGAGSTPGHDFVSDLSADINEPIVNLGEDGDTTAQALARINVLSAYHPKVVILLVGGDDYLDKDNMTQAFVNLGEIIQNIQSRGAVVLLVGERISPTVGNFDGQFVQLVATYHTAYVPGVLDGVFNNPQYMSSDGIHPNDAGYAIIASRILPVLKEVMQ